MGYQCLETDVQTSADGTPYAFHDATLERLTRDKRQIADLGDAEISDLRIEDRHPIPKLADLFEAFPNALFNLDPKTWSAIQPMADLIKSTAKQQQVCIGSFSGRRINAVLKALGPDICHSIGTAEAAKFYLATQSGIKIRTKAHCIQFPVKYYGVPLITRRVVDFAHRIGLKVHVWTVNDAETIRHLIDLGVDGIMSDECHLLKDELVEVGQW